MSPKARSIYATREGERVVGELYASMLARWPVPFDTVTVATRHGPTSAVACGVRGAPPLVLLHGAGSNALMWMGDVARLAERHRVFAVDIIGEPGLDGLGLETTRLIGLAANGQAAVAVYTAPLTGGDFRGEAINLVSMRGDHVTQMTRFAAPRLYPLFGLPERLPDVPGQVLQ